MVRGTLTLAGETRSSHAQSETEPKVSQRKARSEGRFVRRLTLTMEVDTDEVNAEFADAMLQVNLPKRGQGARRWISLQRHKGSGCKCCKSAAQELASSHHTGRHP